MNQREQLAKENDMSIEFVNWFFDNKKEGCGNVWFMMMAAMWEGWKPQAEQVRLLTEQRDAVVAEMSIVKNDYATIPEVKRIGWPSTPNVDAAIAALRAEGVSDRILKLEAENTLLDTENTVLDKMRHEHRADGVNLLYAAKSAQWPQEFLEEVDEFARQLRESKGANHG